jgi:ATP-dependent RNA helicase DeaD
MVDRPPARAPARDAQPPRRTHAPHPPETRSVQPPRPRVVASPVVAPAEGAARSESADEPRRIRPKATGSSMETFRIEVGSIHGIKPSHVVGAIANEAGIEGVHIGRVDIREDFSFVDLPEGMPKQIFKRLQKVMIMGRELRISSVSEKPPKAPRPARPGERKVLSRGPAAKPKKG